MVMHRRHTTTQSREVEDQPNQFRRETFTWEHISTTSTSEKIVNGGQLAKEVLFMNRGEGENSYVKRSRYRVLI